MQEKRNFLMPEYWRGIFCGREAVLKVYILKELSGKFTLTGRAYLSGKRHE